MQKKNNISENNVRLAKNTAVLYLRTILVMFVTFFATRELLRVLGSDNYGIYNVVGSIVVLFSFVSTSLTQATQRYITYELGNGNNYSATKIYNVSIFCQILVIAVFVLGCELFAPYFLQTYLNIPNGRMTAAVWAFHFSLLTFCVNLMRTPCEAAVVAYEDMSFFAIVSIIEAFLKLGIIYLISISSYDKLIIYAILLTVVSFLICIIYYIHCHKKYIICKFMLVKDKTIFKQIFSFSGWSMCSGVTNVMTQNGFVFLLNIFYGVIANASMGIANQINNAVNQFVVSFQTSFRPQIVKAFASQEYDYLNQLVKTTSKFSFLLAFLPISILVINMPLILTVWLEVVPEYAVGFCSVILICSLIDATTGPYYCAIMATGKIAKYQVLISLSFLLDIVACYFLMRNNFPPVAVLSVRILTRGIINMIIGLLIMKAQIDFDLKVYFREVLVRLFMFLLILCPIQYALMRLLENWTLLLASLFSLFIIGIPMVWLLILDKDEKMMIKRKLLSKYGK